MKYRMTIECEAESLPVISVHGQISADFMKEYAGRGTVTSFRIDDVTPTEGEIIPAKQCECEAH